MQKRVKHREKKLWIGWYKANANKLTQETNEDMYKTEKKKEKKTTDFASRKYTALVHGRYTHSIRMGERQRNAHSIHMQYIAAQRRYTYADCRVVITWAHVQCSHVRAKVCSPTPASTASDGVAIRLYASADVYNAILTSLMSVQTIVVETNEMANTRNDAKQHERAFADNRFGSRANRAPNLWQHKII